MRAGRKVVVTIVTDGLPSGPRYLFVEALKRLGRDLPVQIVIRLATDDARVASFYESVDAEVELPLDILDDLRGEAQEIYAKNPWLSYNTTLHTVREAGIFAKVFDLLDERALTPMEASLCTQLLLRRDGCPPYSWDVETFLEEVERDASTAEHVFDGRLARFVAPIDMDALRRFVHPRRYAGAARALRAVGLGGVVDWYLDSGEREGRPSEPGWGESGEVLDASPDPLPLGGTPADSSAAELRVPGCPLEYYSLTHGRWIPCAVTQLDAPTGAVIIDLKPGVWISREQQATCVRPLPGMSPQAFPRGPAPAATAPGTAAAAVPAATHPEGGRPAFCVRQPVEYYSQTHSAWIPCEVVQICSLSGSVIVSVKPGSWITPEQQPGLLRSRCCGSPLGPSEPRANPEAGSPELPTDGALHALPAAATERPALQVGDAVEYWSTTHGVWISTSVVSVREGDCSIMVEAKAGFWLTAQQQAACIRPLAVRGQVQEVRSGAANPQT